MNGHLDEIDGKVVELLLVGCDNATIAHELGMNIRTVKARFSRLFRRFGLHGTCSIKRVQLAMQFRERRDIPKNVWLTDRERAVTELVRFGLNNRQIADRIGTTEFVVKNYLRTIFEKSGMGTRLELALWVSQ